MRERQGAYAAFLGRLMSGASLSAAAVACGIRRESVRDWLTQGLTDQQADIDSYYARFASDVHAAIAHCVSECEIQVATRKPLEYLRTGPGRAFYTREQYWQQLDPLMPFPEDDINPIQVFDADTNSQSLTAERLTEALAVLRNQRLLTDPTFEQHAREQYGLG